jgi:hypothetical protein
MARLRAHLPAKDCPRFSDRLIKIDEIKKAFFTRQGDPPVPSYLFKSNDIKKKVIIS